MINITLPDGSIRQFENPVSVMDVAQSIGAGLAQATPAGPHMDVGQLAPQLLANCQSGGELVVRHAPSHTP